MHACGCNAPVRPPTSSFGKLSLPLPNYCPPASLPDPNAEWGGSEGGAQPKGPSRRSASFRVAPPSSADDASRQPSATGSQCSSQSQVKFCVPEPAVDPADALVADLSEIRRQRRLQMVKQDPSLLDNSVRAMCTAAFMELPHGGNAVLYCTVLAEAVVPWHVYCCWCAAAR